MSGSRPLLAAAVGIATSLVAGVALAQVVDKVGLSLTVSHASPTPGPIDANATDLHRQLLREFRYESLRILEVRHFVLDVQEVGGMDLPTGKRVELRLLSVTPSGALIAVEIPGTLQTDLRVPNRRQVVLGVDRYLDGKLILTLQPEY